MRSLKRGKNISASIENITPSGIWLFTGDKEFFLSYENFPWFKDQPLRAVQNVQLLYGHHLYWPELDVDLEIDVLEHPDQYPLKSKILTQSVRESAKKYSAKSAKIRR